MPEKRIIQRAKEVEQIDRQLRRARDVLIISPPASGLTTFLQQLEIYIGTAEHFEQFQVLYSDCSTLFHESEFSLEWFCQAITQHLGIPAAPIINEPQERRLAEFLEIILTDNDRLRFILALDNLDALSKDNIRFLLQQIRVVSESRSSKQPLKRAIFILGAHSLDLRQYDPKHDSPFNVAEKIKLEDFTEAEALELVNSYFKQSDYMLTQLGAKYICYITGNHPYLLREVCLHLLHGLVAHNQAHREISFNQIDQVVEAMCEEGEDRLLRQLTRLVAELPASTIKHLQSILNGTRYHSSQKTHVLRELALLGIVTEAKGEIWQIRNPIFDSYLRRIPQINPVLNCEWFVPRRLFVNTEGYKLLFQLENDLRDFVLAKMYAKFGEQWWQRVDEQVAEYCQGLKVKEVESGWFPSEDLPSLAYAQLPHLKKIIYGNWSPIFHRYFKPQSIFMGVFEALEGIRNRIAHNRPLTDHEIDLLDQYVRLFRNCMYDKIPSELDSIRIR